MVRRGVNRGKAEEKGKEGRKLGSEGEGGRGRRGGKKERRQKGEEEVKGGGRKENTAELNS